ncbi:2'-deoxynucleoside 5'-phosphate N-hydrolase 1 isoform X2 [Cyprinus carpio]|uniref:2'-deoxynucleoside 5'-phosphate N-hydrolase 1 isoform X2 n=1 Tax=Cyprinus carpio TaxID=7962 RepID=A0A9Q9X0F4_CYPCA|nr:2'-deoxynucleoside 5'-phosphate N-hydrolase 1 isoform X2 [Cyprinus carpio]
MNIYFCGSIRGGRQDVNIYQRIVKKLQQYGTVLTEHVSSGSLSEKGEDAALDGDKAIHDRDVEWLMMADDTCMNLSRTDFILPLKSPKPHENFDILLSIAEILIFNCDFLCQFSQTQLLEGHSLAQTVIKHT